MSIRNQLRDLTTLEVTVLACALLAVLATVGVLAAGPGSGAPVGTYTATGDSMGNPGEQAVLYTTLIEPDVGDEAIFKSGDVYIHHRIVGETPEGYVTKGDAHQRTDQKKRISDYVSESEIVGSPIFSTGISDLKGYAVAWAFIISITVLWRKRPHISKPRQSLIAVVVVIMTISSIVVAGSAVPIDKKPNKHELKTSAPGDVKWTNSYSSFPSGDVSVVDGMAYYAADDAIRAVYMSNGTEKWNFQMGDFGEETIVNDSVVYASDGSGTFYAIHKSNGTEKWSTSVSSSTLKIAIGPENAYVGGHDNTVTAVDRSDGSTEWSDSVSDSILNIVLTDGDVVAVTNLLPGKVHSWEKDTGSKNWEFTLNNQGEPDIAYDEDSIYVISGGNDDKIHAIDKSTGVSEWNHTPAGPSSNPTIHDGVLYYENNSDITGLYLSNQTFEGIYQEDLGGYGSSPTIANGTIYAQTLNGGIQAYDLSDGNEKWSASWGSDSTDDRFVVADGEIAVATNENNIRVIDTETNASSEDSRSTQGIFSTLGDGYITPSDPSDDKISVIVRDANGDPVPNATVVPASFDTQNFQGTQNEIENEIADIRERLNDVEPDAWVNQTTGDFSITGDSGVLNSNPKGVAVHTKSDWDNADLGSPRMEVPSDETIVMSVWDECGGLLEFRDQYESDLDGLCINDETEIVVERIGPGGDVQSRTVESTAGYRQNFITAEHEVAVFWGGLSQGFYRVYPEGNQAASYMISVGNPEDIVSGWQRNLENQLDQKTARAEYLQDLADQDKIGFDSVQTDENGTVELSFGDTITGVKLVAYKLPEGFGANATIQDLRDHYETLPDPESGEMNLDSYPGAPYVADPMRSPYIDNPQEAGNVTVGVQKVDVPYGTNISKAEQVQRFLNEWFKNNSLGFGGYNYSLSNVTDLLELRDKYAGMVGRSDEASELFCERNPEWCENGQPAMESFDPDSMNANDAETLVKQVTALAQTLRDTPTALETGDVTTNVLNETSVLTTEIPLPSPVSSVGDLTATVVFQDGTTEEIDSEYLSLGALESDSPAHLQYVVHDDEEDESVLRVSEWPVPEDKSIATVEVSLGSSEVSDVESTVEDTVEELQTTVMLPSVPESLSQLNATLYYQDGTTADLDSQYLSLERDGINGPKRVLNVSGFEIPDSKDVDRVGVTINSSTGTVEKSFEEYTYLNAEIPFDAPGSFDFADFERSDVSVIMHSQSGETTQLDDEYWRVEQATLGAGSPVVVVEDYPLAPEVAVKRVEVIVAGDAGIGRVDTRIENPAFSGEIPAIESVDANTLYPGPDATVLLTVNPESTGDFGSVESATVTAPDGQQIDATVTSDRTVEFTTTSEGQHRVRVQYTNANGDAFASVFEIDAQPKAMDGPATLVARPGTNSLYALAGDGLEGGSFEKTGVDGIIAQARLNASADAPSELHVHASDIADSASGDTTIRVVRGSEGANVRSHVQFVLHTQAIPDGAHVYIGECPVPKSGNSCGDWDVNGTTATIEGVTASDGTRTVEVIREPTWGDELRWEFRQIARALSVNIPYLAVWPGGFLLVGGAWRRRGGNGGAGGLTASA